jgi:hypothetical protein
MRRLAIVTVAVALGLGWAASPAGAQWYYPGGPTGYGSSGTGLTSPWGWSATGQGVPSTIGTYAYPTSYGYPVGYSYGTYSYPGAFGYTGYGYPTSVVGTWGDPYSGFGPFGWQGGPGGLPPWALPWAIGQSNLPSPSCYGIGVMSTGIPGVC